MYKEHPKTKRGPFCAAQIVALDQVRYTKMIVCPGSDFWTFLNCFGVWGSTKRSHNLRDIQLSDVWKKCWKKSFLTGWRSFLGSFGGDSLACIFMKGLSPITSCYGIQILRWTRLTGVADESSCGPLGWANCLDLNGLRWKYHRNPTDCCWLKSCTTWDVWNPVDNGIFTIWTGAGFLPSTVGRCWQKKNAATLGGFRNHMSWRVNLIVKKFFFTNLPSFLPASQGHGLRT